MGIRKADLKNEKKRLLDKMFEKIVTFQIFSDMSLVFFQIMNVNNILYTINSIFTKKQIWLRKTNIIQYHIILEDQHGSRRNY